MKNLWPGMQGNNNASSIKHVVMLFVKAIQGLGPRSSGILGLW